ncbi:hypothetical protein ACHQM5_019810 [Ranunculus cassubicifolius]
MDYTIRTARIRQVKSPKTVRKTKHSAGGRMRTLKNLFAAPSEEAANRTKLKEPFWKEAANSTKLKERFGKGILHSLFRISK